jgi:hypothetical protein
VTDCPCSRPGHPWLCTTCYTTLQTDVARIPYTLGQLRPIINKTARAGAAVRAPSTGSRPPLNVEALEAHDTLRNLHEHARRHDLRLLARHEAILQFRTELVFAYHRARLVLEPPAARVILGPCTVGECPGQALAYEGELEARCDVCGETYGVRAYRVGRVLEALGGDGTPLRAADAARRLTGAGIATTAKDVENWVKRGHLLPVGEHREGKRVYALYALPDVYALASRKTA